MNSLLLQSICYNAKIILSFALFYIAMGSNAISQQKPNIILIVSDDQGYHDLGSYGNDRIKTPYLDQLASEGIRLTDFYVTSSVCTPSRSSLDTGRYPQRNGTYELFRNGMVDYNHKYTKYEYSVSPERILGTDLKEILISEVLKKAGYYSGYFGKWDLGQLRRYLPLQRGFDEFYGFANTGIDYFTHERYGIPSMFDGNEKTTKDKGIYSTTLFKREALEFLKHISKRGNYPFFLYLSFNAPHMASSLNPKIRGTVQATKKFLKKYPPGHAKKETKRRSYMAAVTQMDYAIGNILKKVKKMGEEKNTLVIFLSDQGGRLSRGADNSPFRGAKGNFYEGGIRVPCIIKWPGHIKKGSKNDNFLSSLEIFPTIVSAAGAEIPDSVVYDGFDMLPVLQGKMKSKRTSMFWKLRGDFAARINKWKWVNPKGGKSELFNLSTDVMEKNDVSYDNPRILKLIKSEFNTWQNKMKLAHKAEPRGPFENY